MKNNKEDLYIAVLKYGKENIGKPFLFAELEAHLKGIGYVYDEFALRQFFAALFISLDSPTGNNQNQPIDNNHKFFLEHTGYFNLLEYQELDSARKSSLQATYFAIIAIFISIISTAASIYYSNKQLDNPTTIGHDRLEQLLSIQKDSTFIELKEMKSSIEKIELQIQKTSH